jgi:transcriptional regulator with XRE-family HTH domain
MVSRLDLNSGGIGWSPEASPELVSAYAQRLTSRRKRLGFSQRDLARLMGVSVNTIQSYETGSLPRGEHFLNLARVLQCSLDWLVGLGGEGLSWPMMVEDDEPRPYGSPASAVRPVREAPRSWVFPLFLELGNGEGEPLSLRSGTPVSFERKWLTAFIAEAAQARLVWVKGPAMQPTYNDGDLLLVDTGQRQVYQGQAYAIRLADCLLVNRVEIRPGGIYRIVSDNRDIALPYEVEAEQVEVLGQVVWCGRLTR